MIQSAVATGAERQTLYVIVWEFIVKQGQETEFERTYGRDGDWARLFARGNGYVRTELLRDLSQPRRFLTHDLWQSQAAYEAFRAAHGDEYAALDRRCEQFSERETRLGDFVAIT